MALQIQLRRGNKATWVAVNPIPAQGEACVELDTGNIKIGDGINYYNTLPYAWTTSLSAIYISSTTLNVSGSPLTSAGIIDIELINIGTSGTFTKVQTDSKGRVISGATLTSGDIPVLPYISAIGTLPWSQISGTPATLSGYGIVSGDTLFNSKYAQISAIPNVSLYLPLSGGILTGNVSAAAIYQNGKYLDSLYVTVSGDTMAGGLITPTISATTISGDLMRPSSLLYGTTLVGATTNLNINSTVVQVITAAGVTLKLPNPPITGLVYQIYNRANAFTISAAQSIYYNGTAAVTKAIPTSANKVLIGYDGSFWGCN